jgi:multidrug efflux pump subunit AcrA (membrane-fusion protein)
LASVLTLLGLWACSDWKASKSKADAASDPAEAVPVKVVTAEYRQVLRTVEAVGSLFAYDETVVSSEVDGRAEKVLVETG